MRVLPGLHTHYILVLDPTTFDFQGAGEAGEYDIFKPRDAFSASLVIGGDVSLTSRSHVLNQTQGDSYAATAFVDGRLNFLIANNPLLFRLQVEEGQGKLPNLPWQKTKDRVALDSLYIYRWRPWIGPYARFNAQTNLFDTFRYFSAGDPASYRLLDVHGNPVSNFPVVTGGKLQTGIPFGLTTLREGAGVNTRVLKTTFAEANVRVGPGARHTIARQLYTEINAGQNGRTTADFQQINSASTYGVEVTVLAIARLSNYVIINIELDTLTPFLRNESAIIDMNTTAALKLTQFVSLNYIFNFQSNRNVSPRDQIEHDILMRFSLAVP